MFAKIDGTEQTCSLKTFPTTKSAIDDLSIVICCWIVLSEVSAFVLRFPAGVLMPRHYNWLSLVNFVINVALTIILTPVLACLDFNEDSVNLYHPGSTFVLF